MGWGCQGRRPGPGSSRRTMMPIMAHLAQVLGQMRDIRMPHRMRNQGLRQPQRVTVGDEPGVDLRRFGICQAW